MFKSVFAALALIISTQAQAQVGSEYILDNLPAGMATEEVFFTGKWCTSTKKPFFGTRSLRSCGRNSPTDYYFYQPVVEAGTYDVYIRWVDREVLSTGVEVAINYSYTFTDSFTGIVYNEYVSTSLPVNQSVSSNGWFYVGRFPSLGGVNALGVRVTGTSTQIANTDGARFVRVE
jgi:hypothetical protein